MADPFAEFGGQAVEDADPFAQFGGQAVAPASDPFAEFGGQAEEPSFLAKVDAAAAAGVQHIGQALEFTARRLGLTDPAAEQVAARNFLGREPTEQERAAIAAGGSAALVAPIQTAPNKGITNKVANALGGFVPAAGATLAGGPAGAALAFGSQSAGAEQQASAAAGEPEDVQAARAKLGFAINAPAALIPGSHLGLTRPLARVGAQLATGAAVGAGTSAVNDLAQSRAIDTDAMATNAILMGLLGSVHQAVGDQVQMRDLGKRWAQATGKQFDSNLEAFADLKKQAEAAAKAKSDAEVAAARARAATPADSEPSSVVRPPSSSSAPQTATAFLEAAAQADAAANAELSSASAIRDPQSAIATPAPAPDAPLDRAAAVPAEVQPIGAPAPLAPAGVDLPGAAAGSASFAPPVVDFFNATPAEIDAWSEQVREFERNTDVLVFGEEAAKRYRRLVRAANSSDTARADASAREQSEMEDALSPAQQEILFGRNLPESYVGTAEARDFARSANAIAFARTPGDLGIESHRLVADFLESSKRGTPVGPLQAALMKRTVDRAKQLGLNEVQLLGIAVAARARHAGRDAPELMGLTDEQAATAIRSILPGSAPILESQNPLPAAPTAGSQAIRPAEQAPTGAGEPALGESPVPQTVPDAAPARKSWQAHLPAHPLGHPDLLDAIAELGGLKSRASVAKKGGQIGGEYDYPDTFKQYPAKRLVHPHGLAPDEMAASLGDLGYNFQGDVPAMLAAVERAVAERARAKPMAEALKQESRFASEVVQSEGRKAGTGQIVPVDTLRVGAKFKARSEPFEVIGVNPDTGATIVRDGPRFGTQEVPAGTPLRVDNRTLRQPKADVAAGDPFARRAQTPQQEPGQGDLFAGGETGGDTLFNLEAQQGTDFTGAIDRLAEERAAIKAQQQAQGSFGFSRRALPPDTRVTVQAPFEFMGVRVPGFAQVDFFEGGRNTRSASLEQLAAEGYELPPVTTDLPTAQFHAADLARWRPGLPVPQAIAAGFAARPAQLAALRAALPELHEKWRANLERLAPGLARDFRLRFGDPQALVEMGRVSADQLTGTEQAAYDVREQLLFLFDTALQANPDWVTLINLQHEMGHVFWHSLEASLQRRLVKQWQQEVAAKRGPLYDKGALRDGVASGVETDVQEWFAESVAWTNHQWAKRRLAGETGQPQPSNWLRAAAQQFRDLLQKIGDWLRSVGRLPPRWAETLAGFREFLDQGPRWEPEARSSARPAPLGFPEAVPARSAEFARRPSAGLVDGNGSGMVFSAGDGHYANVPLAHMDKVRIIEMPELVELVRKEMGAVPEVRQIPRSYGYFSPGPQPKITLDWRIFKDSVSANKTLAHEIGHWTDFMPEGTMKRGNILGRIATLREFLDTTLPLDPANGQPLTAKERAALRRQAVKETGGRPASDEEGELAAWRTEVSRRYHELLDEQIEERGLMTTRGEVNNVREELMQLTDLWRPIDWENGTDSYLAYRSSSKELYADAISVLFNSPGMLKEKAPLFWESFWAYLDRKPDIKAALFEIQQQLHAPGNVVRSARRARMQAAFAKGEEIFLQKAAEREARMGSFRGWWDRFRQDFDDLYHPLVGKARTLKAQGRQIPRASDPDILFEEHPLADNRNHRMLSKIWEDVVRPLEADGVAQADLGEYMLLHRIAHEVLPPSTQAPDQPGGRANLANPHGHTALTAQRQLLHLRYAVLGKERYTRVVQAVERLHDILQSTLEEAVAQGSYGRDTYERVIKPNRGTYATFAVLDYLQDFVPAGIKAQRGSFKDVANPFTATVLKMVSLNRLNQLQKAKNGAVKFMADFFPQEIKPAETFFDGRGQKPRRNPDPDGGDLELLVDGKPAAYWVPKDVAQMFDGVTPARADSVIEALNLPFRKLFYPLFIQYNPAFQLALSPIRDMRRTWVNVPGGLGIKVVGEYLRNYASLFTGAPLTADATTARNYLAGRPDSLIAEMMANSALGLPYDSFASGFGQGTSAAFETTLRRFNLLPPESRGAFLDSQFLRPARALLERIEWAGLTMETLPKVSTYRILREELHWSPDQAAAFVRNNVGVPNFRKLGRHTRVAGTIFPFLNVFLKGYQADIRLATAKQSRAGWWLRWAAGSGGLRLLAAAGAAGLLGAAIKELYDGVSEYDKTNYLVVPLGRTSEGDFGGKTVYLRLPEDEMSRLLGGIVHKAITGAAGDNRHALGQLFAFGTEQTPSVNPLVKIGAGWTDYLAGQNPMDGSRGVPILSNTEYLAGGWPALEGMTAWTYEQTGIQNFFRYDTRAKNWMELGLSAVPGINRLLKVSDYGHLERQRDAERQEAEEAAQIRVAMPERVRRLYGEYQSLRTLDTERMTPAQARRKAQLSTWYGVLYKPAEERLRAGAEPKSLHTFLDERSQLFERE